MPAVLATYRAKKLAIHFGADARRQVNAMLDGQNLTGLATNLRDLGYGAIGCLGGGALPAQGNGCFFTGLPINGPNIGQLTDADSAARLFPSWDGAFTGVYWDAQQEVLVVVTDCLGMQPLYMRHGDGELTLVSETKALQGEPDLAAWGAFISIGHPIGDRSLMSGLRRVPPASILVWHALTRTLDIRRYWDWPEPSGAWRSFDFLGALEHDIRGYAAYGESGTLLLSGGFDSRLLLFLLKRAQIDMDALIVAHDDEHGDADGRLAASVAKLAGVPHQKLFPPQDFFSSRAYLDFLRASDAGFPSLDLFIAKVASLIHCSAVWEGVMPGCLLSDSNQPEAGIDAYLKRDIRGSDSAIWRAATTLFKPDVASEMSESFSADLQMELSRVPQDSFGLARFVIENRVRNRTGMEPLKVYANHTMPFIPGLSRNFVTHSVVIPLSKKRHKRFHLDLVTRLDKRALVLPFLSGGELIRGGSVGPTYHRERLKIALGEFRTRHPSLYLRARHHQADFSRFLGAHLFGDDDRWLHPAARTRMKSVNRDNYLAWKLLFHWKAWQWVHGATLDATLGVNLSWPAVSVNSS